MISCSRYPNGLSGKEKITSVPSLRRGSRIVTAYRKSKVSPESGSQKNAFIIFVLSVETVFMRCVVFEILKKVKMFSTYMEKRLITN